MGFKLGDLYILYVNMYVNNCCWIPSFAVIGLLHTCGRPLCRDFEWLHRPSLCLSARRDLKVNGVLLFIRPG